MKLSRQSSAGPPPRVLFSSRTLLIAMLCVALITLITAGSLGAEIANGEAIGAVVGSLLLTAFVGEFIRQRFRLSLRVWLFGFTALAVLLGLYSRHMVATQKQLRATQTILARGGRVFYDFKSDSGDWFVTRSGVLLPGWFRRIFSSDLFGRVERVHLPVSVSDSELATICEGIPELHALRVSHCQVTDAGLQHLTNLQSLEYVTINGKQLTAKGVSHLANVSGLKGLQLDGPDVTDDTLVHLKSMPQMRRLNFFRTAVGDGGNVAPGRTLWAGRVVPRPVSN